MSTGLVEVHSSWTRGHNAGHHEGATTQDAFGGEASAWCKASTADPVNHSASGGRRL
jgi:hypothetical protein